MPSVNYERAKRDYHDMVKDGWVPAQAANEAAISYVLTLKEQAGIHRLPDVHNY